MWRRDISEFIPPFYAALVFLAEISEDSPKDHTGTTHKKSIKGFATKPANAAALSPKW